MIIKRIHPENRQMFTHLLANVATAFPAMSFDDAVDMAHKKMRSICLFDTNKLLEGLIVRPITANYPMEDYEDMLFGAEPENYDDSESPETEA